MAEATFRLSVDTGDANRKIREFEKNLSNVGKGVKPIECVLDTKSLDKFKEMEEDFRSNQTNGFGSISGSENKLQQQVWKSKVQEEEDYIQSLQAQAKVLEKEHKALSSQLKRLADIDLNPLGSVPGSEPPNPNPSPNNPPTDPEDDKKPKSFLSGLLKGISAYSIGKAAVSFLGTNAQKANSLEENAYQTYARTDMFEGDYNQGRRYSSKLGKEYGYRASEIMGIQGDYLSLAGYHDKESLTKDTKSIAETSRAYGLDAREVTRVSGEYVKSGVLKPGEVNRFASLFAKQVKDNQMQGREEEQLRVLEQISSLIQDSGLSANQEQIAAVTGIATTMANQNPALKGERGLGLVETAHSAIQNGDSTVDYLLGRYDPDNQKDGYYETEHEYRLRKEQGIYNLDNLKEIDEHLKETFGSGLGTVKGNTELANAFGMSGQQAQVDAIANAYVEFAKTGTDASGLFSGADETFAKKLKSWENSEVAVNQIYESAKESNSADLADVTVNAAGTSLKEEYNKLPSFAGGAVSGLTSLIPSALSMVGVSSMAKKATPFVEKIFTKPKPGAGDAADEVLNAAGKNLDDAVGAFSGAADDVASGIGKGTKVLGKLGKAAGIIGIGLEVISTGLDVKKALDEGDGQQAAKSLGSGIGSIGGGLGGAAAGAAIGTAIMPVVGTAIGGVIGGVVGSVGGSAIGEATGEAAYNTATGQEDSSPASSNPNGPSAMNSSNLSDVKKKREKEKKIDGSHATGLDYVPFDGYLAELHKGERVLTKQEAEQVRSSQTVGNQSNSTSIHSSFLPTISNASPSNTENPLQKQLELSRKQLEQLKQIYKAIELQKDSVAFSPSQTLQSNYEDTNVKQDEGYIPPFDDEKDKENKFNFPFQLKPLTNSGWISGQASSSKQTALQQRMNGDISPALTVPKLKEQPLSKPTDIGNNQVANTAQEKDLAQATVDIISSHEGSYDSINYNDVGAVSVGKIQWNGARAKGLLNQIREANPEEFQGIVQKYQADSLVQSLDSEDNWSKRTFTRDTPESKALEEILRTETSQKIQDELALNDTQSSIDRGKKKGITDPQALAFYADLTNQYGPYHSKINESIIPEALEKGGGLDAMYQTTLDYLGDSYNLRSKVKKQVEENISLEPFHDHAVGKDYVPYDGYPIRAHRGEMLLTKTDADQYRKSPISDDFNIPSPFSQLPAETSNSTGSFQGKLEIVVSGSVEGMNQQNQDSIVQAILQKLSMLSSGNILNSLSSSMGRAVQ